MTLRVRFAPISTGYLHVGNVRIALVNWLYARARAGRVLLRLNDTDEERCKPRFAAAIEGDLDWLGLDWDEFARQSERMDRYRAAFERLKGSGRIYPCYETPEELEVKRRSPRVHGRPPVYDRAALALGEAERASLEAAGRRPHWRFLLKGGEIAFDDMVRGSVRFAAESLSDPVLFRAGSRPLYVLRSVVDDLDLGVTHVIRGEDYLSTTAVQFQLAAALGAEPEALSFAHLPLLTDVGGHGLSKRLASLDLRKLRSDGIEPMAVASLLARLGTSEPIKAFARLDALARDFGLAKFSRAAPRFDTRELARINAKVLHSMPFAQVVARLRKIGLKGADERFWKAVRPNLARLADAETWWRVCAGKITPVIEDPGFAAKALELLPPEPWDDATWRAWTAASAKATGRKGRALSLPLRLALTGLDRGPELKDLLPLVGRGRAAARLKGIRA